MDYTRDRNGVETDFLFDSLGRTTARIQRGIQFTNVLDAAGRTLKEMRSAGGVTNLLNQYAFYADGRLQSHINALGGETTYSYSVNGTGQTVSTTTYPDGGTRIETRNKDGTLASVTGTAVQPVRYVYDIENDENSLMRDYTKEIKLNANGTDTTEWTKTYRDLLDRPYLVVYNDTADGTEAAMPRRRMFYNALGQLEKETMSGEATRLFGYSNLGEQVYTVTDVDMDGVIDFDGTDRVTASVQDVISAYGTNVVQNRTWVWDANSQNVSNLVSRTLTSVDGRRMWMTTVTNGTTGATGTNGPIARREISVLTGNAYTVTNTAPDGSHAVETYRTGRLASVTRYESGGGQIGATARGYDHFGRMQSVTDVRNGTTFYTYNAADQPIYVTTPPPGNGQAPQTTSTYYSSMMRATNVVYADGGSVTNEFYTTGALKKTSGSRTYPVEYTYDPQGRMKTMKTWQNFAGNSGAATTTWHYNERGFLTRKEYADSNGPEYTYNDAGKLLTRKWARGTPTRLTTTYAYNNAGDLWTTAYNDGVTPGVTNLYDRRGRLNSIAFNGTITSNIFHYGGGVLAETNSGGTLSGISVTNAFDSYLRKSAVGVHGYTATLNAYTYDTAGRLSVVSDGTNSATYSYIANSPLVGQITFKENTTTRMTTIKKYDHLNRLSSIVSTPSAANEVPIAFEYAYNDANQRTRVTMEDGSFWIYKYDKLGQVTSGKRYWVDGTPVAGQQFEYAFDDIGNRTTTKEGGDATGAASALRSSTYTLSGNLLNQYSQKTVPNVFEMMGSANSAATVTVDGQSTYRFGPYFEKALTITNSSAAQFLRPIATAALGGYTDNSTGQVFIAKTPETFSYDLDGNTIEDGRWTYKWDGENRLIEMVSLTNTPTESKLWLKFGYDSRGRRIQKNVAQYTNSAWSLVLSNRFVYDGWNSLAELNAANNALLQGYLWGKDLSGSVQGEGGIGGQIALKDAAHAAHFLAFDASGNIGALMGAVTGAATSRYEFGPFGEEIRASGTLAAITDRRQAGKQRDRETGLSYYGYRFYSGQYGRWLSRDPIGEHGGLGLSAFVRNNPISFVDALGKKPEFTVLMQHCELRVAFNWKFVGVNHSLPGLPDVPEFKWDMPNSSGFINNNSTEWKARAKKTVEDYYNGLKYKCKMSADCSCENGFKVKVSVNWGETGDEINVTTAPRLSTGSESGLNLDKFDLDKVERQDGGKKYEQITIVHETGHYLGLDDTYNQYPMKNPGSLMSFGMEFLKEDFDKLFCNKIGAYYDPVE